jgi:hypothetical protein
MAVVYAVRQDIRRRPASAITFLAWAAYLATAVSEVLTGQGWVPFHWYAALLALLLFPEAHKLVMAALHRR